MVHYQPEDLESLVEYFESKGIYFSSKRYENHNRYAIMRGKTSLRILDNAKDGVNGIVLFCYKDKEDLNRIQNKLNKEIYPNSEATRPFKISILDGEIDLIIDILKENENNIN